MPEDVGADPAGTLARGDVAVTAEAEDVEAGGGFAGIDEPVFADAREGVGSAEDFDVLADGAATDDFEDHVVQTRQVLLVPQQVLVPYVQTTATGPIRVGTQDTQVLNLAAVTNTTAQATAVNAVAAGAALPPRRGPQLPPRTTARV